MAGKQAVEERQRGCVTYELLTYLQDLFPGENPRQVCLSLKEDDRSEVRKEVPDGQNLLQLDSVAHHDDVGPAVPRDVAAGRRAAGLVDAGREGPGVYGGHVGDVMAVVRVAHH